jgi:hypothetical protein
MLPDMMCCWNELFKLDNQDSSSAFRWRHMLRLGLSEKYMSRSMFPEMMDNAVTLFCGVSSSRKFGSYPVSNWRDANRTGN